MWVWVWVFGSEGVGGWIGRRVCTVTLPFAAVGTKLTLQMTFTIKPLVYILVRIFMYTFIKK